MSRRDLSRYFLAFAAVTFAYWTTAVTGLRWSIIPGAGTAVWPASGVAFAALALGGLWLWPALVLGRLLTFSTIGSAMPFWAELMISFGTTAAAVLPVWLLNRRRRLDPRLGNMRDMLWLILGGALVGAVISSGVGVLALLAAGTDQRQALSAGLNWFFGYGVGLLIVGPLLLAWWPRRNAALPPARLLHLIFCIALTAAAAAYLFLTPTQPYFRVWHMFPFLVWAAVAFQVRGASLALLVISMFAVIGAIQGTGPLALGDVPVTARTLLTQQFVGMIGATILLLGAAIDERRNVEAVARLAAMVRSSPEAMISYDAQGKIRSWNKGAELLFGYSAAEVIGQGGEILLPPDQPEGFSGVFALAVQAGGPIHLETVRMSRDGRAVDVAVSASPMYDPQGPFLGVASVMRDITDRKKAELHQRLLIGELNHRVKNTLAVVQGLAQQTFRDVEAATEARSAFEGRLLALAAAHNILTDRKWENAGFREIVEAALRPFLREDAGRISLSGPDLVVRPQTAVAFAMVLHELATNAVKYGALRPSGGRLDVDWSSTPEDGFLFHWVEQNDAPIEAPRKKSFGSRLIERSLASEIGADVEPNYTPDGLRLTIRAPHFAGASAIAPPVTAAVA